MHKMFSFRIVVSLIFFVTMQENRLSDGQDVFDHFVLAFQWPKSFCNLKKNTAKQCIKVIPDAWKVHGLWPSKTNSLPPTDCYKTNGRNFNLAEIAQDAKNNMDDIWPNMTGENRIFWEYEWKKHGSCANMDINVYFTKVVELTQQFDIGLMLANKNILPGGNYPPITIRAAILDTINKIPRIVHPDKTLLEIRVCFTIHFDVIDCKEGHLVDSVSYPEVLGANGQHALLRSNGNSRTVSLPIFCAILSFFKTVFEI